MAKELFLNTSRACFLCFREPLSDTGNLMSEVSLRKICRYLKISPSSVLRTCSKDNLLEEEKDPRFLKEKCEFSVTMCSTCSSLTTKLTDLINQMEMINDLLTYQLQIFHQTINRPAHDSNSDGLRLRAIRCGSSSEMEISLVEALRVGIDKKCSQKVNDILKSNIPKVFLEPLEHGNQEKNLSPLPKNVDSIKTEPAPLTRNDVSSLQSFPILQDPLSLSPQNNHLATAEPVSEILLDPLADQAIPQNSQSIQLEDCWFHKQNIKRTCKKYSKILQNKIHCTLCSYSIGNGDVAKIRFHLLNVHPEILFTSQKPLEMDNVSFNIHCRRLLSNELFCAKQRAGNISSGKNKYYLCEICERKILGYTNFKYHLLMNHFKIVEEKLIAGFPTLSQDQLSSSPQNHHLPNLEPEPEILLDPPVDQIIPQNSQPIQLEVKSHKRRVLETCKKYSKILPNEVRCSLCTYSYRQTKDSAAKLRYHLVGVHPEILFTSQRRHHLDPNVSFNDRCRRLMSNEISRAKQRATSISTEHPCYPCEFCERKSKSQFDFKYHLLMKHFKIMEEKLSAGNCGNLEILHRHLRKDKIKDKSQSEQPVADDGEIFIVPDLVVNERIKSGKEIAKRKNQTFQKRKAIVCSKEDGGCGKLFWSRFGLMNHKRKHCRSIGRRESWTCEIPEGGCGLAFTSKSNLQRHQQIHCFRRKRSEAEGKEETMETDDNFSVSLEYAVEDVVMSKVEVFDDLDN